MLLCPTTVSGYSNGVLQSIQVVDWGADRWYIDCHPVVCYSYDALIDAENQYLLDNITHNCVDMEASVCKETGVCFTSNLYPTVSMLPLNSGKFRYRE